MNIFKPLSVKSYHTYFWIHIQILIQKLKFFLIRIHIINFTVINKNSLGPGSAFGDSVSGTGSEFDTVNDGDAGAVEGDTEPAGGGEVRLRPSRLLPHPPPQHAQGELQIDTIFLPPSMSLDSPFNI